MKRALLIVAAWSVVALGAVAFTAMRLAALGRLELLVPQSLGELAIIPIWAVATPWILDGAARRPVRGAASRRHLAFHAAVGATFVVLANVAIRLPLLARGVEPFTRNLLLGLGTYFVPAMLAYAAIVTIGQWTAAPPAVAADAPAQALTIRDRATVSVVPFGDIQWIESEDNYVLVHTADRTYTARQRLNDVERQLGDAGFVRIHRSAIVRKAAVQQVRPLGHGDYEVLLRSGASVRGSRSRRATLDALTGV